MVNDPTDERYRKPRRLRNTKLQKFIRNASLVTAAFYTMLTYFSWKRHVASYLNSEQYKQDLQNDPEMSNVNGLIIFEKNVYDKLTQFWKKEAVSEVAKDNI